MARRPDDKPRPRRDGRGGRSGNSSQSRSVLVSKAFSKLLRHQAQNEGIPISKEGWVRVSDVLGWRGLGRAVGGGEVTLEEVAGVVEGNDKKRLALRWERDPVVRQESGVAEGMEVEELGVKDLTIGDGTQTIETAAAQGEGEGEGKVEEGQVEDTVTERAVRAITSGTDVDPTHYLIRAVQGHSMRSIGTDDLLTPITLFTLEHISTDGLVVHGTFYGAWRAILASGGLKSMGRNHVHFATGPRLDEVQPGAGSDDKNGNVGEVMQKMEQNKVISGMRRDAQVLIYVDVRRALQEVPGMQWWRSENGVVLTEGWAEQVGETAEESSSKSKAEKVKIVPMSCWETVVEVKQGHGVIWTRGEGLVKELPDALLDKGMPPGKGRGAGKRGRGR